MIIVGIDVASLKHDYFMIQAETGVVFRGSSITIANCESGYKKLHEDIQTFCGATRDHEIRIGLESTGIYHTNIITFLISKETLIKSDKALAKSLPIVYNRCST